MTKHIANILTGCRIFGSILLLFFPVFSLEFYITYILCGFSDMIDGIIARKTNSASKLGSQLDTIADFIFVVVSFFKLLPAIHIPEWLWIWGGVIAIIKFSNIIRGYVSKKQFISLHTIMNKVTGLLLFLWPLTTSFAELKYSAIAVCAIATFSAIQEVFYVISGGVEMTSFEKIYEVVRQIPVGKVSTYGHVAKLAGNPRWSRVVGYALHVNPAFGEIPCHRVVNRMGRTAPAFAFGGSDVQRAMLEAEGVTFLPDGTVDMKKHLWMG